MLAKTSNRSWWVILSIACSQCGETHGFRSCFPSPGDFGFPLARRGAILDVVGDYFPKDGRSRGCWVAVFLDGLLVGECLSAGLRPV